MKKKNYTINDKYIQKIKEWLTTHINNQFYVC